MADPVEAGHEKQSSDRIDALEAELERAKERWATCAEENARVRGGRRGRARKADRTAAELEQALAEYGRAWRTLEDARREAGLAEPVAPIADPDPAEPDPAEPDPKETQTDSKVSLNRAGFDELHESGMSVTQARRVIRYREKHGKFTSVDDLDQVPGFPDDQLARLKGHLVP